MRPLKMSLNYQALVEYYEGLIKQGITLQANETKYLEECRRFVLAFENSALKTR